MEVLKRATNRLRSQNYPQLIYHTVNIKQFVVSPLRDVTRKLDKFFFV